MRSPTEFHGVAIESVCFTADLDDSDKFTVFITEELHDVFAVFYF